MPDLQEKLTATAQQATNGGDVMESLVFVSCKMFAVSTQELCALLQNDEDLAYEEDILRNSYSIKTWLRYIEFKRESKAPPAQINIVYERALRELPGRCDNN